MPWCDAMGAPVRRQSQAAGRSSACPRGRAPTWSSTARVEGGGRGWRARAEGEGGGRGRRARQPTGRVAMGRGAGWRRVRGDGARRARGEGRRRSGSGAAGARPGQELEGEARLVPAVGPRHVQVAQAGLALVVVTHAPALAVGHRPTGVARRVGAVGPVRPALVRQVAHDLAAVSGHLPGSGVWPCDARVLRPHRPAKGRGWRHRDELVEGVASRGVARHEHALALQASACLIAPKVAESTLATLTTTLAATRPVRPQRVPAVAHEGRPVGNVHVGLFDRQPPVWSVLLLPVAHAREHLTAIRQPAALTRCT